MRLLILMCTLRALGSSAQAPTKSSHSKSMSRGLAFIHKSMSWSIDIMTITCTSLTRDEIVCPLFLFSSPAQISSAQFEHGTSAERLGSKLRVARRYSHSLLTANLVLSPRTIAASRSSTATKLTTAKCSRLHSSLQPLSQAFARSRLRMRGLVSGF